METPLVWERAEYRWAIYGEAEGSMKTIFMLQAAAPNG